ncbi:MAG: hypothetical protein U0Q22_07935 [Acidimicrobiales bacterium]
MNASALTPSVADRADRMRLGELAAGPIATGGRGGTVVVEGAGSASRTTISWWIGAEDRWHRPADEASARHRLVDGAPVLECLVRVPSGDAVGRIAAARVDGADRPSVILDVENSSPLPVAFAWVVESTEPITSSVDGLAIAGVGTLSLTRPALGYATGGSLDTLADVVSGGDVAAEPPADHIAGAAALMVPLPHTAHAVAVFTPDPAIAVGAPAAAVDRERVPAPDRIVAGWTAHRAEHPRIDAGDARRDATLAAATADLLMGPWVDDDSALVAGTIAEALGRLGRVDTPGHLIDVVESQRGNGSVDDDDPVAATAQLLAAAGAWWNGGCDAEFGELLVGPVANALRWLSSRRRRSSLGGRERSIEAAVRAVDGLLVDLGQPEAAADARRFADDLVAGLPDAADDAPHDAAADGPDAPATATALASLGDRLAWVDAAGHPAVATSARFVSDAVAEIAHERNGSLVLLDGWRPAQAGLPIEAHGVPTRWGSLSFGVRWHGERPALLWEIEPWSHRPQALAPVRLTAPRLDPAWSGDAATGEALLAAPAGAPTPEPPPAPPTTGSDPIDGGSFT